MLASSARCNVRRKRDYAYSLQQQIAVVMLWIVSDPADVLKIFPLVSLTKTT